MTLNLYPSSLWRYGVDAKKKFFMKSTYCSLEFLRTYINKVLVTDPEQYQAATLKLLQLQPRDSTSKYTTRRSDNFSVADFRQTWHEHVNFRDTELK